MLVVRQSRTTSMRRIYLGRRSLPKPHLKSDFATAMKQQGRRSVSTGGPVFRGRGERIRTSDLSVPNAALYQAEPRPDRWVFGAEGGSRTHMELPPTVFETVA